MKQWIIILLAVFSSCKKKVVEEISSLQAGEQIEVLKKERNQDNDTTGSIQVVDYNSLKPLLDKRNDTTYVVNFWATWCKPCIEELPAFEKLHATYRAKDVKVVLVSLDFPEKINTQVLPFIKKHNLQSSLYLLDDADANFWIPAIDASWSGAIPATIIYNAQNRKFYERSFTFQELETEIKTFLK